MDLVSLAIATRALLSSKVSGYAKLFTFLIGWCGDSITNGSSSTNASVYSFRAVVRKLIGYRVRSDSFNGGVPGERSSQLLARIDGIIAQGVNVLCIMIGTNDASQSIPLASYQANIKAMKAKADAKGIPIVLCLVPPRGAGASASSKAFVNSYNMWLRFYCAMENIPLADTFSALVDRTTGSMDAAYDSGDNTHPNNAGHAKLAAAIASVLDVLLPKMPWPVAAKGGGLAVNPLAVDTSGWSTVAGTAATRSVVPPSDNKLPVGNWMRFTLDNTAGSSTISATHGLTMDTAGFAAGDVLLCCMHVTATSGKIQVMSGTTVLSIPFESIGSGVAVPFMFKYTVPEPATNFRFGFLITAAVGAKEVIDIGAADVFNLTALGLTDIVI